MATALGVIAIIIGLIGSFIAGWVGVGIVVVLAGLAILLRVKKNKEAEEGQKKMGAIVCGIVGIFLAIVTQIGMGSFANKLKETADQMGPEVSLISSGAEGFKSLGIIGFISKAMDAKPADMTDTQFGDELKTQLEKVSNEMNKN